MKEINFGVKLDDERSEKLDAHLKEIRLTKRAFMEMTIDELPAQLTKKKGSK